MKGLNPKYLAKLDPEQQQSAITGHGKLFLDEFVFRHGNHCFVGGTTGSGKTNKGYWLVNWLKHTELQIWMDSGKSEEIIPLLCQGMPVHLIVPKYADVIIEERINGKWERIQDHPTVSYIPEAGDTWWHIKKNHINILCFRNAFWTVSARALWLSELFETLATWSRLGKMPGIFPFTLHIDETQWLLAGIRITKDSDRVKSGEVITENALEIRSQGGRLIMYAQDFLNIPPAIRENLVCAILCRGCEIKSDVSKKLSAHCFGPPWVKKPANFSRNEGKFITEEGKSSPTNRPWQFSKMPKSEEDQIWIRRVRVRYIGFNDQKPASAETEEELIPDLGRFQALAIPPEKVERLPQSLRYGFNGDLEKIRDQEEEENKKKEQEEFLKTWGKE